jgi:hypothetical protein
MNEVAKQSKSSGLQWLTWIFAAVGLLGVFAVIYLAIMINGSFYEAKTAPVVAADGKEVFEIGEIQPLAGSNIVAVNINADDEGNRYGSAGISKGSSSGDQRNILFIDKITGNSSRLFPDNSNRIVDVTYLSAMPQAFAGTGQNLAAMTAAAAVEYTSQDTDAPVAYYLLEIAEIKGQSSPISILVGTLASRKQAIVMKNITSVENHWMLSKTELGLLVREKQELYFKVVNIPDLKMTKSVKIEIG